jgi:hypothetical protein
VSEDSEDRDDCESCHFRNPLGGLHKTKPMEGSKVRGDENGYIYLCDICYRSHVGNHYQFPGIYENCHAITSIIAWVGNYIMQNA